MGHSQTSTGTTAEQLYEQNGQAVYRYVLNILRHPQDAEDVTATTFETALGKLDQAQSFAQHRTWLITIARNHMSNRFRKKDFVTESEQFQEDASSKLDELIPDSSPDALQRAMNEEIQHKVADALAQLPDHQREIVALKIWEKMTIPQIAEVTESNEMTVKSNYYRALKKLRELLAEEESDWRAYFLAIGYINVSSGFQVPGGLEERIHLLSRGEDNMSSTFNSQDKEHIMDNQEMVQATTKSKHLLIVSGSVAAVVGAVAITAAVSLLGGGEDKKSDERAAVEEQVQQKSRVLSEPLSEVIEEEVESEEVVVEEFTTPEEVLRSLEAHLSIDFSKEIRSQELVWKVGDSNFVEYDGQLFSYALSDSDIEIGSSGLDEASYRARERERHNDVESFWQGNNEYGIVFVQNQQHSHEGVSVDIPNYPFDTESSIRGYVYETSAGREIGCSINRVLATADYVFNCAFLENGTNVENIPFPWAETQLSVTPAPEAEPVITDGNHGTLGDALPEYSLLSC